MVLLLCCVVRESWSVGVCEGMVEEKSWVDNREGVVIKVYIYKYCAFYYRN